MKLHLAGVKGHQPAVEEAMKIFLAGWSSRGYIVDEITRNIQNKSDINVLESYYYARDLPWISNLIRSTKPECFILDSGAYTFMQNTHITVDWEKYNDEYAAYINDHNIELFFELDIDAVVGLPRVEKLRERLEKKTGKRPIPVWHRSRGKQNFLDTCKEYDYVAVGGIAIKTIKKSEYGAFHWLIHEAHKRDTKIHALGFTNLKGLTEYDFDSVDSTAWIYGNRGGYLYKFNGKTLIKVKGPQGHRLKAREAALNNFVEWVKFAKYMEATKGQCIK